MLPLDSIRPARTLQRRLLLFVAAALLAASPAHAQDRSPELVKILTNPNLWGQDFLKTLPYLDAWESVGEDTMVVSRVRIIGRSLFDGMPEARRYAAVLRDAVRTDRRPLTEAAAAELAAAGDRGKALRFPPVRTEAVPVRATVLPAEEESQATIGWTKPSPRFLPANLDLDLVRNELGPPERIEIFAVHGEGSGRPEVFYLHRYSGGAVTYVVPEFSEVEGRISQVWLEREPIMRTLFGTAR